MKRISGRTAVAIAGTLEQEIADGTWANGPLPTVRALAGRLRVAPATVANAYRLLRDRGLTVGGGRRGTRVRAQVPTLTTVEAAHTRRGPREASGSSFDGVDCADVSTGNPDAELLPSFDAALRALPRLPPCYPPTDVVPALASFASSEFAADDIPAGPIAVTSGALDAVERLLRERLRPGDRVAIEDPNLPALIQLIAAAGFHAVGVAVDGNGPLPASLTAALAQRPAALIVTPRAHNPTGAALTAARAVELKRVLRETPDIFLLENDAAGVIAGRPMVSLVDRQGAAWAVIRSFSKALGPDLRVAVVTGDALTITRVRARQALGARWVSHLLQHLALALWSDPGAGRHLARTAAIYAARRRALTDALAGHGLETIATSGFNVWVGVREEVAASRALAESGWLVAPGEPFRLQSGPGIRITTSALAPADAPRLAAAVAAVRHRARPPSV